VARILGHDAPGEAPRGPSFDERGEVLKEEHRADVGRDLEVGCIQLTPVQQAFLDPGVDRVEDRGKSSERIPTSGAACTLPASQTIKRAAARSQSRAGRVCVPSVTLANADRSRRAAQ